jgi:hypothetical protein
VARKIRKREIVVGAKRKTEREDEREDEGLVVGWRERTSLGGLLALALARVQLLLLVASHCLFRFATLTTMVNDSVKSGRAHYHYEINVYVMLTNPKHIFRTELSWMGKGLTGLTRFTFAGVVHALENIHLTNHDTTSHAE